MKPNLREVSGVVVKQEVMIKECRDKIETLQKYNTRNILRITELVEVDDEEPIQVVQDFLKNNTQIEKDIKITDAHRIGKGKNRVMLMYLRDVNDKWHIFSHSKNLAGQTGINDKSF